MNSISSRMDDVQPKKTLTLDDIQSEDWLIRTLATVSSSKAMDVPPALLDELNQILGAYTAAYHKGNIVLPTIREVSELEELAAKESQCVSHLARVAEITISLYRMNKKVEDLWDMCEERINRYPVVSKELTNDRKRTLFYKSVLKPLRDKQSQIELALQTASKVEEYLNNLHFAIREVSAIGRDYLVRSSRVDVNEMR